MTILADLIWESQNNIISAVVEWSILYKSITFTIPYMFKSYISLRIFFWWHVSSITERNMWKSITMMVVYIFIYFSFETSLFFFFLYSEAMLFCVYKLRLIFFLVDCPFLYLLIFHAWKSALFPIGCMIHIFHSFTFTFSCSYI